ncbi:signal peptidase I [Nocardioides sp. R1-1]|uniref:signal peptidase I n=1 Tax=Nocardioides sp. R1-1 TaxID=3383502 RepID=UPI0038D1638A
MTTWPALTAQVLARAYLAFLLTLAVIAVAPAVADWQSYVVDSGSMRPEIEVGDVVVARGMDRTEQVQPGRVFVFEDPARPEARRLLVHRVVERSATGDWVTKGDANASADVEAVPREAFRARARVLVPLIGLPSYWWRTGDVTALVAWTALTLTAILVVLLAAPGAGRRRGDRRGDRRGERRPTRAPVVVGGLVLAGALALAVAYANSAYAGFTATTRNPGNSWAISGSTQQPYSAEVLADDPSFYYLLDEASGSTAADASGRDRRGTLSGIAGYRAPGALPRNFGYAMSLGTTGRVVSGGPAQWDPTTFTLELWFRTTSRAGGKLVGFESAQGDTSALYDRQVTLRTDGRLVYGDWNAVQIRTITSPATYNDGQWHHLVLTAVPAGNQQQSTMYVDGVAVATGTTTRTTSYSGWWRVGHGKVRTSLGLTTSAGFPGEVDQVAVYPSALTGARVRAHYAAR